MMVKELVSFVRLRRSPSFCNLCTPQQDDDDKNSFMRKYDSIFGRKKMANETLD